MQLSWSIPYLPGPNRITPMQICELWRKLGCQPMVMASNGLFLILSNLEIMRSMGVRTNLQGNGNSGLLKVRLLCRPCLFASCEKVIAPNPSRKQMKTVCASFQSAAAQAKCTCHGHREESRSVSLWDGRMEATEMSSDLVWQMHIAWHTMHVRVCTSLANIYIQVIEFEDL